MLDPNPERRRRAVSLLASEPYVLDAIGRAIVDATVRDHCRLRGWTLSALSVRTNHVHVVVAYPGIPPERMVTEFKAYATRRLRTARRLGQGQRAWVFHGSTRYLWKPKDVDSAVAYVELGQD